MNTIYLYLFESNILSVGVSSTRLPNLMIVLSLNISLTKRLHEYRTCFQVLATKSQIYF